MIANHAPDASYKANAEKEIAQWSAAIAEMSWQEMAQDLLDVWEDNEKELIRENSRFRDFDYEVLKRKADLYRARIFELAVLV